MSNLTYASPCEVRPNRDRDVKCEGKELLKLWILEFEVKDNKKGCAVIKAPNANKAVRILFSNGTYNGSPTVYQVTRIEEIIKSPDSMLICEQIAVANEN